MKIVAIYKEQSDHARQVREFLAEFERRVGVEIEVRDPEDWNNQFFLQAYDIVEYPTIIALSDGGSMLQMWRGKILPTIDEVSYYV